MGGMITQPSAVRLRSFSDAGQIPRKFDFFTKRLYPSIICR